MRGGRAIRIAEACFWSRITRRTTNRNTRDVEVVIHDTEIVWLGVIGRRAAVKQPEIVAKLMHADPGNRVCWRGETVVRIRAERDEFRFAVHSKSRRGSTSRFIVYRTVVAIG